MKLNIFPADSLCPLVYFLVETPPFLQLKILTLVISSRKRTLLMKYDNQVKGAATTSFELQKNSKSKYSQLVGGTVIQ